MKRGARMGLICAAALLEAALLMGCMPEKSAAAGSGKDGSASAGGGCAVRTVLRELVRVDPEKGIGVYGRYTELSAEGEVPDALPGILAEVNARARESVETRAERFLAENGYPASSGERVRYRTISHIANVTRADSTVISVLETELETGIGDKEGERIEGTKSCRFHSSVYDAESGRELTPADFLEDPGTLRERLEAAFSGRYGVEGLCGEETPAWTSDYLGLSFFLDGAAVPEEKRRELASGDRGAALHVSIPYAALDGPLAKAAAKTPESFIARIERNTDYALPHDRRVIRVEKDENGSGSLTWRIVIREGKDEKAWWLEYADDSSDYFVLRAGGKYYFYRLDDGQDRGYVYNFARPDGGFDRFENQNAQCFDSFLKELHLALPWNPECVHMREKSRRFMDSVSGMNTSLVPNGHYAFLPEPGRGRTWLHFALIDDGLALDSHNVGCRLLHDISAAALDEEGNESGETVIPAGEVLRFLRVDGEGELYFYMSPDYRLYSAGARDYLYDCALSDGSRVRLVTRLENNFFVDGMYLDRIGEPVSLGAPQYEAGLGDIPEHYVEIGGKKYRLITDLSLKTEGGEEIDFDGDIWWKVENYVGTFSGEADGARLVISEDGEARFEYDGRVFEGRLPEKRYYGERVEIWMEAGYEGRSFQIIVEDKLPRHDPSFTRIRLYSPGEPATNEPSTVPPIEVKLTRDGV